MGLLDSLMKILGMGEKKEVKDMSSMPSQEPASSEEITDKTTSDGSSGGDQNQGGM